jgi:hypothetical protein
MDAMRWYHLTSKVRDKGVHALKSLTGGYINVLLHDDPMTCRCSQARTQFLPKPVKPGHVHGKDMRSLAAPTIFDRTIAHPNLNRCVSPKPRLSNCDPRHGHDDTNNQEMATQFNASNFRGSRGLADWSCPAASSRETRAILHCPWEQCNG